MKKELCLESLDLLAPRTPHSSGFCGPGCTCLRALPLELGWGVPPLGCGTACEAGTNGLGSSCGLPGFPWNAETSAAAVEMATVTTGEQRVCGKNKTAGQTYRGGRRHPRASREQTRYFVELRHELCKLQGNGMNKCLLCSRFSCSSNKTAASTHQIVPFLCSLLYSGPFSQ